MARVTDFRCVDERGERVPCDAFGNNVAFNCPNCGHPILAIIYHISADRHSTNQPFADNAISAHGGLWNPKTNC